MVYYMVREFTEQEQVRRDKLADYKEIGVDPFRNEFTPNIHAAKILEKYDGFSKEELSEMEVQVKVAGRIMTKREMGKAAFVHIQDMSGQIQAYIRQDQIAEQFDVFKLSDIGDLIGVKQTLVTTNSTCVLTNEMGQIIQNLLESASQQNNEVSTRFAGFTSNSTINKNDVFQTVSNNLNNISNQYCSINNVEIAQDNLQIIMDSDIKGNVIGVDQTSNPNSNCNLSNVMKIDTYNKAQAETSQGNVVKSPMTILIRALVIIVIIGIIMAICIFLIKPKSKVLPSSQSNQNPQSIPSSQLSDISNIASLAQNIY